MNIDKLFNSIAAASFMGSFLILIILLTKSIFKQKLNCYFHYYIWILIIIKLLLPFSFQSNFSIYNTLNLVVKDNIAISSLNKGISLDSDTYYKSSQAAVEIDNAAPTAGQSRNYLVNIISIIWLSGSAFMMFLVIGSNYRIKYLIKKSLGYSNEAFNNIFLDCLKAVKVNRKVKLIYTNGLSTPSLYGIINPTIIIPLKIADNIDSDEFRYIILHELSHLKRKDVFLNLITTLLQCIYWFNPIVLYGLYKMKQDCEIACDQHVISYLKDFESIRYGDTLIRMLILSNDRQWIPGTTSLSKNKFEIKRRITMITKHKKLSLGGIVFGIALIAVIGVIGLTSAKTKAENSNNIGIKASKNLTEISTKSISITLHDNIKANASVTFGDIVSTINELKNLGANKISINGEQIYEINEISPSAQFLKINGKSYGPPYIIKGEWNKSISPDSLIKDNSTVNKLKSSGIEVKIES